MNGGPWKGDSLALCPPELSILSPHLYGPCSSELGGKYFGEKQGGMMAERKRLWMKVLTVVRKV